MKTLVFAVIRCSLLFLLPTLTYATSAQWDLDAISGDWNTPVNWTPMGIPNGPADIAIFGLSNTTDASISTNTEVNGAIFTPAATNPYTITASPGLTLTISGVGIVNISGTTQNFVTAGGEIRFRNHATAGDNVTLSNDGGTMSFFNHSSTGGATFVSNNGGITNFFDHSTASGFIDVDNESFVSFYNSSSAGTVQIQTEFAGGAVSFFDHSTGGSASLFITEQTSLSFGATRLRATHSWVPSGLFIFPTLPQRATRPFSATVPFFSATLPRAAQHKLRLGRSQTSMISAPSTLAVTTRRA
jgi:hypothetical protein